MQSKKNHFFYGSFITFFMGISFLFAVEDARLINTYKHPVMLTGFQKQGLRGGHLRRPELAWVGNAERKAVGVLVPVRKRGKLEMINTNRMVFMQNFNVKDSYEQYMKQFDKNRGMSLKKALNALGQEKYYLTLELGEFIPRFDINNQRELEQAVSLWGPVYYESVVPKIMPMQPGHPAKYVLEFEL